MRLRAALLLAAALSSGTAQAQALQCQLPPSAEAPALPRPDGPRRVLPIARYTLALTWSPEFCHGRGNAPGNALQCGGRIGRFGFILHGLWPENTPGNWPQWCSDKPVPAETVRRNLCLTPSPALIVHEWAKHGSCMARSPEGYFRAGAALVRSLRYPDMPQLSRKPGLAVGDLRREMAATNTFLRPDMIRVKASPRGWLTEMHICYGRNFMPATCSDAGPPDNQPLKIWRSLPNMRSGTGTTPAASTGPAQPTCGTERRAGSLFAVPPRIC